jgi:hypothetical protein
MVMMLPVIIIVCAASLLQMQNTACPHPDPTAWEQEEVVGKVNSLRIEEIHYSYTKPERELKKRATFDIKGNYIEIEEPDLLPRVRKGPPPAVYTYNSNCKPVERKESIIYEDIVRTTFRYDEWGRKIESAGFDEQGRLVYREISLYNQQGKVTEKVETIRVHPEHFRPMRYDVYRNTRTEFRYDQQENETEEIEYDFTGKYYGKYTKRYDEKKRLIELTRYDHLNRPIKHTVKSYDSDGRINTEEEYRSFTYDRDNNLVPGTIKTSVGPFQMGARYLYIYDASGNWIEKKGYEIKESNGEQSLSLDSVTYRTIKYYD